VRREPQEARTNGHPYTVKAVAELRALGFGVCSIAVGDKAPKYGFTKYSLEPADFEKFPDANVGILGGTLSGDLVIVDLDTAEIRAEAAKRLPHTMTDGRPSTGAAHYYYRVTDVPPWATAGPHVGVGGGPRIIHFSNADGRPVGLDFLGTGGQVVCPPSLHHSGERRRWFVEPKLIITLPYLELWAIVRTLALDLGAIEKDWECVRTPVGVTGERRIIAGELEPTIKRAVAYIAKCDPAISGHGGHNQTMWAARVAVWGYDLGADIGYEVLLGHYNPRCDPEWSCAELMHKCRDADCVEFGKPRGWLLDRPNEDADDPHRLARIYIAENCEHPDGLTLHRWREQWFKWDGLCYRKVPDAEMVAVLTALAKREMDAANLLAQQMPRKKGEKIPSVKHVTKSMIANIEMALASMTTISGGIEQPSWFDGQGWQRRNLLAMSNGLLDLDAYFAGMGDVLLPHTPRWFSPVCLPYPFDQDAKCPRWEAFLKRNLEEDSERIALLQEFFGLTLTPDTSLQKFLLMFGKGGNGKSVACAALEGTLGSDNCSHVPLELFGARFQLAQTLGKLANISAEIGELDKAAEGYLKQFVSGDPMPFEEKYKDSISCLPTARLVLATNNKPRFRDRSNGIWRRMVLMPWRVTIADDDPSRVRGMDKAEWWAASGELPGLLIWALEGLKRLRDGWFTESEVCKEAWEDYRTETNPARRFLLENCEEAPAGVTPCEQLYQSYARWCVGNGYSPLGSGEFGKEVHNQFDKVERKLRGPRDGRVWVYVGIQNAEAQTAEVMEEGYKANGRVMREGC
jgi:P4 family phage/plasmid primase-like protien